MEPSADDVERERLRALMRPDLLALLADAGGGQLSSAEFSDRLNQIHTYHLGAEAEGAAYVAERAAALNAFEGLSREPPSRHHELELLAAALGVEVR